MAVFIQANDAREEIKFGRDPSPLALRKAQSEILATAARLEAEKVIFFPKDEESGFEKEPTTLNFRNKGDSIEESLKPIIATMLKEYYNK